MKISSVPEIAESVWDRFLYRDNCVAWIGSGLSVPVGYDDWTTAVSKLCDTCGVDPPNDPSAESLLDLAQDCKERDERAYYETLHLIYGREVTTRRKAYSLLLRLNLTSYVTTNFDPVLFDYTPEYDYNAFAYPDLHPTRIGEVPPAVFYLHGLAHPDRDPEQLHLVFARNEFSVAYESGVVSNFLRALLTDRDILFLGCSLSEPVLKPVFREVDEILGTISDYGSEYGAPKRLAVRDVPRRDGSIAEEKAEIEEERLKDLGIEVLWYKPENPAFHEEIEQVLTGLCRRKGVELRPSLTPGVPTEGPQ